MTHVAQFGLQFHRCGHIVRATLAESRVTFVGVPSGRGDGNAGRSGRLPSRRPGFCKPCWLCEGALVSNGINARIIKPSHGLPSVEKWNSVGEAWTPASSRHKVKVSTARPPHSPSLSTFKPTWARCADQATVQVWYTCVSAI